MVGQKDRREDVPVIALPAPGILGRQLHEENLRGYAIMGSWAMRYLKVPSSPGALYIDISCASSPVP